MMVQADSSESESDDEVLVGDHLGTALSGKEGAIRHDLIVLRNPNSDKPTSYAIPIPDTKPTGLVGGGAGTSADAADASAGVDPDAAGPSPVIKGSKLAVKPGGGGYQTFAPKSHRHPMFPHTEERIKSDDYGQVIRYIFPSFFSTLV